MQALVSIHDVMPATLSRVSDIIDRLPAVCRQNLVLLVVPGLDWQVPQIEQLSAWQQDGMLLAGHGWQHQARSPSTLYHHLHAALISRQAAEHLSLSEAEIVALMVRNFGWFPNHDLAAPDLYVPPAWALGSLSRSAMRDLPFHYIETTRGCLHIRKLQYTSLPLSGFECDTRLRESFLRPWNLIQAGLASQKRPLRIAIHPDDFSLRLADQLSALLNRVTISRHYATLNT